MAGSTGLEPATSGVTGRRSNQLNYDPASGRARSRQSAQAASVHAASASDRAELHGPGGRYRIRTCDSRRVKPVLYH